MQNPIINSLKDFYNTDYGKFIKNNIKKNLITYLDQKKTKKTLTVGYGTQYFEFFSENHHISIIPDKYFDSFYGLSDFKKVKNIIIAKPCDLPFQDDEFDVVIAIHLYEFYENNQFITNEFWRILKPSGKLVLIAPNKYSICKYDDIFKNSKTFSLQELKTYLFNSMFTVEKTSSAIFVQKIIRKMIPNFSMELDRYINYFFNPFSMLFIIEASKNLCVVKSLKLEKYNELLSKELVGP